MQHLREGNIHNPRIYIISDFLRVDDVAENKVLGGFKGMLLANALARAGITNEEYCLDVIYPFMPYGMRLDKITAEQAIECKDAIRKRIVAAKPNLLVPLGNVALELVTGLSGIDNWQCSILKAKADVGGTKTVPLYHPADVLRSYTNIAYISFGCGRIKKESVSSQYDIPSRTFHIGLSFEDTISFLNDKAMKAEFLSPDIETGLGQINTFGLAISGTEAIAIKTLPSDYPPDQYLKLWQTIAKTMQTPIPKVFQNFIYETQYLSKYGIWIENVHHDTMVAMKFLHPELEMGLHNVGRIYTRYPYWKQDGKDWTNIGNWKEHLEYNCKDTTGTLTAFHNQVIDLKERGLHDLFYQFVMQFAEPVREMCTRGLLVDEQALYKLRAKVANDIEALEAFLNSAVQTRLERTVNFKSHKQVKTMLADLGYKIPLRDGEETTDKKAIIQLKKKYPKEELFDAMLKLSASNKMLGSYLNFTYDTDKRVRYSLNIHGTETGRWSGYMDPWDHGFNPQTVPKFLRKIFVADPGCKLMQIDLSQAESRYVAWDAPDAVLMRMISDGEDVHRFVAGQVLNKNPELITKEERQLGKKIGHAANYGVGPRTFAEACLTELDFKISESEARRIIALYMQLFPGVKRRQLNIQEQVKRYRKLTTPMGRERIFYDRVGDEMFRQAYAYCPQSTIPDITNSLMLKLVGKCNLLLQVHDSLLLQVMPDQIRNVTDIARDDSLWHPRIDLPGGSLRIPVEIEIGDSWGEMTNI